MDHACIKKYLAKCQEFTIYNNEIVNENNLSIEIQVFDFSGTLKHFVKILGN